MIAKIVSVFRNERSAPLLSFIIGVGVAVMLFHRPIVKRLMLSLPLGDVEGRVVRVGDKCVRYHAEDSACELSAFK